MLRIYKEGGGRGGLGLEVERWEGIVREVGYDPIGLKEMGDAEKKVRKIVLLSAVRACVRSREVVALKFLPPVCNSSNTRLWSAAARLCPHGCSSSLARSTRKCVDASRRTSYRPSRPLALESDRN